MLFRSSRQFLNDSAFARRKLLSSQNERFLHQTATSARNCNFHSHLRCATGTESYNRYQFPFTIFKISEVAHTYYNFNFGWLWRYIISLWLIDWLLCEAKLFRTFLMYCRSPCVMRRKVTVDSTQAAHDSAESRRPSVFERLGPGSSRENSVS